MYQRKDFRNEFSSQNSFCFAAALLRFLGSEARGADWFPVSGDLKRFYNLFLWSEPRFCAKQGVLPAVFEAMAKPILSSVSTDR